MIATINGKIVLVSTPKRGVSSRGNEWVSQDYVIEDEKGEKLAFNVFGQDKINEYNLSVGAKASVTVNVESREWQGKWFTSVKCASCISNTAPKAEEKVEAPAPTVATENPFKQAKRQDINIDSMPF
jgi:hypothetical protein